MRGTGCIVNHFPFYPSDHEPLWVWVQLTKIYNNFYTHIYIYIYITPVTLITSFFCGNHRCIYLYIGLLTVGLIKCWLLEAQGPPGYSMRLLKNLIVSDISSNHESCQAKRLPEIHIALVFSCLKFGVICRISMNRANLPFYSCFGPFANKYIRAYNLNPLLHFSQYTVTSN